MDDTTGTNTGPEPSEARFSSSTPADGEPAIERAAGRDVADFAAFRDRIAAEVGQRYEAQIAAKGETIATQREPVAQRAGTLGEARGRLTKLRRRAEVAERGELRARAVPEPPSKMPTILVVTSRCLMETPEAQRHVQGLWARLRRMFGEE